MRALKWSLTRESSLDGTQAGGGRSGTWRWSVADLVNTLSYSGFHRDWQTKQPAFAIRIDLTTSVSGYTMSCGDSSIESHLIVCTMLYMYNEDREFRVKL